MIDAAPVEGKKGPALMPSRISSNLNQLSYTTLFNIHPSRLLVRRPLRIVRLRQASQFGLALRAVASASIWACEHVP